ncbi:hypothetical protein H5410_008230 [Solanum commersonii]|uniref:Uncharacterized protein n=1 Tax=Solanum commersonii TaxID=4109 RepID=A0A9J6AFG3_SOLCO|nr:hypothetical protein H5410_008230 [Solanum commersonii]
MLNPSGARGFIPIKLLVCVHYFFLCKWPLNPLAIFDPTFLSFSKEHLIKAQNVFFDQLLVSKQFSFNLSLVNVIVLLWALVFPQSLQFLAAHKTTFLSASFSFIFIHRLSDPAPLIRRGCFLLVFKLSIYSLVPFSNDCLEQLKDFPLCEFPEKQSHRHVGSELDQLLQEHSSINRKVKKALDLSSWGTISVNTGVLSASDEQAALCRDGIVVELPNSWFLREKVMLF